MDVVIAQGRLEVMLTDLDRSIAILRGEHPERELSAADAGSGLCDSDRVEAALESLEGHRSIVRAALARIDAGTYGQCLGCGHDVPEGRLEVRPDAARCLGCQTKHDRAVRH
ncbi:TraR/DksA C4-type zinc finger protein [Actinomadura barringtoniae]|uniref:TraR/DksA C4-type zinc finger protein n=1 Tax=Actinomadura barringtoniae TaxID=1427535 RepID=A0A939PI90_9ACTN|nr:TraR/DksA C4-type zinc finger protein [Actinomadura barringtoniae]MBO2450299.1 TraR/DksA C4-type zinc finger protein [Actinomadura barringtoniae]